MHSTKLRADLLLLLTALIWGFAFVAQRVGMEYVGPYYFNAARFALGCLPLIPFVLRNASGSLTTHLWRAAGGTRAAAGSSHGHEDLFSQTATTSVQTLLTTDADKPR